MWRYHLQTAFKSLRRNPWLTAIVIGTIGLGIGVCMTSLTVFHLSSRDPIPAKSDRLVTVRLNNWPVNDSPNSDGSPPYDLSYRDAQGLVDQGFAKRQAAGYNTDFVIHPEDEKQRPYLSQGRLTSPDFFSMFEVDFVYGAEWTQEQERDRRMVAVLSATANDKIFGGENSVGREVRVNEWTFTVVGVLEPWNPLPKFYDINSGSWQETEEIFVPFSLSPVLEARKGNGSTSCFAEADGDTWQAFLDSECVWVQFWAELASPADLDQYQSMVEGYVANQRDLGRFPRTENVIVVQDVMTFLRDFGVVDDDARVLLGLAFLFLVVCLVNVVGLLLDKFLLNPGELAVRRALGARRKTLLAQRLVEVAILGLGGAALGLLLAMAGLRLLRTMNVEEAISHLDPILMLVAVGLSVGAALLAGLYPAWRGSRIPPARYLRT